MEMKAVSKNKSVTVDVGISVNLSISYFVTQYDC